MYGFDRFFLQTRVPGSSFCRKHQARIACNGFGALMRSPRFRVKKRVICVEPCCSTVNLRMAFAAYTNEFQGHLDATTPAKLWLVSFQHQSLKCFTKGFKCFTKGCKRFTVRSRVSPDEKNSRLKVLLHTKYLHSNFAPPWRMRTFSGILDTMCADGVDHLEANHKKKRQSSHLTCHTSPLHTM